MPFKNKEREREYQRIYQSNWRIKNPIRTRQIRKKAYETLKIKDRDYWRNNYLKNKVKIIKSTKKSQARNNRLNWKVTTITNLNWKKDNECGICKTPNNLQFHHWLYKLPVERKDFSTLCTSCHWIQHGGKLI